MVLRRWIIPLAATLVFALSACLLYSCEESPKADKLADADVLDIGVAFPENDWRAAFMKDFAAEVAEKSGGTVKTRLHYVDEYPDMTDALREVSKENGKLDIALTADAYMGDISIPDLYVSGLPYMFEDFEDAWAFAESDVNAKIESNLPQYNMRVLSHFCGGFRSIGAIKPIEEPDDMDGLVIATVKSLILMDMLYQLGAEPQPSIAGELHDALERGIYSGVEITIPTYWRDRDFQYAPYIAITNHAYNLWSLIIDERVWQNLSDENKKVVKEAAEKYAALERAESKRVIEGIIDDLEKAGATVTHPDYEKFRTATEEVREKYSADYPETYAEVMAFLDNRKSETEI